MRRMIVASLVLASVLAVAQVVPERLAGRIVARDGHTLHIRTAAGDAAIELGANVRIVQRVPMTLDDIRPGSFVATTAAPGPDGTLVASELRIFAESLRGNGEGHRPMGSGGNTMTHATVHDVRPGDAPRDARSGSTMTNATVSSVAATGGARTITVAYPGGEKVITIPASTPIALTQPAGPEALTPGENVVITVSRSAAGAYTSDRVTVGVNGSVPPL